MTEWTEIARFPSRLEAEAIGHALDQFQIPFLVQSHDVGMFGPGMTGWTPAGASLQVPFDRLDEVRELLTCVVSAPEDADLPEELRRDEEDRAGPEAEPRGR